MTGPRTYLGVQQSIEIDVGQPHARIPTATAGEMPNDIGLHGGKDSVSQRVSSLIQEISSGDSAIFRFGSGVPDDPFYLVHLCRPAQTISNQLHSLSFLNPIQHTSDDVVECNDFGITDLLPRAQGTKRRQPLQDGVRQLVSSQFEDDPLELFRSDVAIAIFVKVSEGLSETFTLETLDQLGEFRVCRIGTRVTSAISTNRNWYDTHCLHPKT